MFVMGQIMFVMGQIMFVMRQIMFVMRQILFVDWSVYTCLTQLYGGRDMYNLLHKDQLHVLALFGHLQVDN